MKPAPSTRSRLPFALGCVWAVAAAAHPQQVAAAPGAGAAPTTPQDKPGTPQDKPGTPHDKEAAALALASRARGHWDAKNYLAAAPLFMEAYAQVPEPTLLFNAARAYQQGGRLREAVPLFELYLRLDTFDDADSAAGRRDAQRHLDAIRAELDRAQRTAQAPPTTPAPAPQPTPAPAVPRTALPAPAAPVATPPLAAPVPPGPAGERPAVRRPGLFSRVHSHEDGEGHVAAYVTMGSGGALLLAGIALHIAASAGRGAFDDRLAASRTVTAGGTTGYLDVTQGDAEDALTTHDSRRAWGTGLAAVGAGALAAGVWLWQGHDEPAASSGSGGAASRGGGRAALRVAPRWDAGDGRIQWEVAWQW